MTKFRIIWSYAQQCFIEWKKHSPGRVVGHYCGSGDRILPFQIEKMNLIMKLALPF
jgi:hypothetical protein